jgi:plasmid maintenance system antidote protein VapI
MAQHELKDQATYDPNSLLDTLISKLRLKNDAALCRALEVAPPVISKIRHKKLPIGASMLIRMHEVSDLSIRELRDLMGDRRQKYRASDAFGKPHSSVHDQHP